MKNTFVFDLDGTLIHGNQIKLDDYALKSLELAKNYGEIIIASARPLFGIKFLLPDKLNITKLIALNGALIFNKNHIRLKHQLEFAQLNDTIRKLTSSFEDIWVFTENEWFVSSKMTDHYKKESFIISTEAKELSELTINEQILKIIIISDKSKNEICGYLGKDLLSKISVVKSNSNYWEINSKGVNKYVAIKDLCSTGNRIIAFGDSDNDVCFLKNAYFSSTVSNATTEVKNIATYVANASYSKGVFESMNNIINLMRY